MKWTVVVNDPLNTAVLAQFENGVRISDGVVALRRFDPATVTPPGQSKNLNVYGRQDFAQIGPRSIVQLLLDDTPVFWGPAVVVPSLSSPGAGPHDKDRDALERITVVGGEQLLRDSVIGPRLFEGVTDVAIIAFELCRLYAHPALIVDQANFPATGAVLSIFYSPEKDLESGLRELAETVPGGAAAYVDATGAIHFTTNEEVP